MIVKKVPTAKHAPVKSKAHNVRALADYIAGPKVGGAGEKVEHRAALNLLNLDHDAQVQEMIDLAELAKRSPQPVQHWIMSWREGEQPTPVQADEAVKMFLAEMGLAAHQVIYALHRDTDNWHLHLAVNRVHPETEKVVTVNNRFDHEIAHRAIARVEHAQGWQSEDHTLYRVQPDRQIERSQPLPERDRRPSTPARDFEERAGERSAERIAVEEGAPTIREARSWHEIHGALARQGMRFERKGSGAILWVGDQPVKASSAGRDCSMSALQRRLGDFVPDVGVALPVPPRRAPDPIVRGLPASDDYVQARRSHYEKHEARRNESREHQRQESQRLVERHRRERAEMFRGSWKGRGELLNALRSLVAARQAQERAELRERQLLERDLLQREHDRFPTYERWLAERSPELAQEYRHRDRQPSAIEGARFERPVAHDIRAFKAVVDGWKVHYHVAVERGTPAFTDRGRVIQIHDSHRRESILAALQLGAQKWGTLTIHGNERFRRMCVELAAEHGFKIANPDLEQAIVVARERLRDEPRRPGSHDRQPGRAPEVMTPAEAYRRHLEDLSRDESRRRLDPSRIDAEVAVRMHLTGHTRSEIVRAIKEAAPLMRPDEKRDWNGYAERAASYAFGVPGSRLAELLRGQEDKLLEIEGRWRKEPELLPRRRPAPDLGR